MKYLILVIAAFLVFSCSSAPPPPPFTVNLDSFRYEAGEVEAYFEGFLPFASLNKNQLNVYYYPDEDAVCLQFKVQYVNCNQFWDKAGRDAFVAGFKRYQEEYEQRKLVNRNRKTRDAYGSVQGFFMWKKTSFSVQAHGSPKINIGYQFKDNAVFFTTTQAEAVYEDPMTRSRNQTSPVLVIYFTREQAASLVELFKQEHLQGFGKPAAGADGGAAELDGY